MRELSIDTTTHGRVLVRDAAPARAPGLPTTPVIVTFHGYGQSADDALAETAKIPGADGWTIVAIQALHRFYTRGDLTVVGSWMTRQNRDQAIADNVAYVERALEQVLGAHATPPLILIGFSQGVAMAYRAAIIGRRGVSGIVALAGDIPPELQTPGSDGQAWPPVLIGVGDQEQWYSPAKVERDLAFLASRGVAHEIEWFRGGHVWTDAFRAAAGRWIARVVSSTHDAARSSAPSSDAPSGS